MKSYNVKEIAELLQTNPETVRRWIRKGKLEATRGSSRKEGSSVSSAALQKFLEDSPKYAASAAAFISSPAAMVSVGVLTAIGGIAAAKMGTDNAIENASVDTVQICAYINKETDSLKESIARKKKTISQLTQEIEKDERSLKELGKLLEQIKAGEAEEPSRSEGSEGDARQKGQDQG